MEVVENAVRISLLTARLEGSGLDPEMAQTLARLRVRVASEKITDEGRGGSGIAGLIFGFGVAMLLYMRIIL
jgi:hypothetical protein